MDRPGGHFVALMFHPKMTSGNVSNATRTLHCKQQQGQHLTCHWIPDISLEGNPRETLGFVRGYKIDPWRYRYFGLGNFSVVVMEGLLCALPDVWQQVWPLPTIC